MEKFGRSRDAMNTALDTRCQEMCIETDSTTIESPLLCTMNLTEVRKQC